MARPSEVAATALSTIASRAATEQLVAAQATPLLRPIMEQLVEVKLIGWVLFVSCPIMPSGPILLGDSEILSQLRSLRLPAVTIILLKGPTATFMVLEPASVVALETQSREQKALRFREGPATWWEDCA